MYTCSETDVHAFVVCMYCTLELLYVFGCVCACVCMSVVSFLCCSCSTYSTVCILCTLAIVMYVLTYAPVTSYVAGTDCFA